MNIMFANNGNNYLVSELDRAFVTLDVNIDGRVCAEDLLTSLRRDNVSNCKQARKMIWEYDDDLDGALNYAEFLNAFITPCTDTTGNAPRTLYSYILYKLINFNRDGAIEMEELHRYLRTFSDESTANNIMDLTFGKTETTCGEVIEINEWLHILEWSPFNRISLLTSLFSRRLSPLNPLNNLHRSNRTIKKVAKWKWKTVA